MSALAAREIALVTQLEQFGECELDASQVQIKKADDSISNFIGDSPASEQCTQEVPDSEVEGELLSVRQLPAPLTLCTSHPCPTSCSLRGAARGLLRCAPRATAPRGCRERVGGHPPRVQCAIRRPSTDGRIHPNIRAGRRYYSRR